MAEAKPKTTYSAVLGSVLARLRADRGFGQVELAARLALNQSSWSRIERGATPITVEQLARTARALGVRESEVLRLVELSVDDLTKRGIVVEYTRTTATVDRDTVLVGAAAVAAIVGGIIASVLVDEP